MYLIVILIFWILIEFICLGFCKLRNLIKTKAYKDFSDFLFIIFPIPILIIIECYLIESL